VPTAREELIADWRRRLAAAGDVHEQPSSHATWLACLRARLYRFLLSLYGDGRWNASLGDAQDAAQRGDSVVFAQGALPLAGKQAKSETQIRAVFSSLAKAQDHVCPAGPIVGGLPANSWVVAAAASGATDIRACLHLLRSRGIQARRTRAGDDDLVEVMAGEREAAFAIIAANQEGLQLSPPRRGVSRVPPWGAVAAFSLMALTFTIPVAWMLNVLAAAIESSHDPRAPLTDFLFTEHFFTLWRGSFIIALLLIWLRVQRAGRAAKMRQLPRIITKRSSPR
jgi:hypothetical protein